MTQVFWKESNELCRNLDMLDKWNSLRHSIEQDIDAITEVIVCLANPEESSAGPVGRTDNEKLRAILNKRDFLSSILGKMDLIEQENSDPSDIEHIIDWR